jgi:glucan biosynthesis protein C
VGIVLCMVPEVLARFSRITLWSIAFALLGAAGMYVVGDSESLAMRALGLMAQALLAWMAIRAVFALFRRYTDRPSRTFRYLSDASYSIYLFHHLIVIVVATALLSVPIGPGLKFPIVLACASILSLAIYHLLIRRSAVLGYLFNGAVPPAARPPGSKPTASHAVATAGVADTSVAPSGHGTMPGPGRA